MPPNPFGDNAYGAWPPGGPPGPMSPYGYPATAPGYSAPPAGYPLPGQSGPPPPGRRGSGTALIVIGSVILALSVLGILGQAQRHGHGAANAGLAVGQCITDAEFGARIMDPDVVDCGGPNALYELASRGDGAAVCPDGKREDSRYALLVNDSLTLCFVPNLREGACYHADAYSNLISPRDCADSTANTEVARRVDGQANACGPGTKDVSFTVPARSYCLQRPR
jgi:hypothetical protein